VRSTIAIDVAAPPEVVFRLARDVTRWPALLPHYVSVRVIERADERTLSEMVARRPLLPALGLGIPVAWRARTWSEPETLRLRFQHVAGATRGMDVTWRIEPTATGCRVSIEHVFRRRIGLPIVGPLLGDESFPRFVDLLFTRPIAARTLATFRTLAEAVAPDMVRPTKSDRVDEANLVP
jgi:ribosome-associated toxin RatA of RatAB toxin-antitoxin module